MTRLLVINIMKNVLNIQHVHVVESCFKINTVLSIHSYFQLKQLYSLHCQYLWLTVELKALPSQ